MQAAALRLQIEKSLSERIPNALTPLPAGERETVACGIPALDALLQGGFPIGAIAEVVGPECSGRTTAALSFLAKITSQGEVCAWIDASDAFDPESAAANGVMLQRLLWVRCARGPSHETHDTQEGITTSTRTAPYAKDQSSVSASLSGGGPHPRSEGRGMPQAIAQLLTAQPRSAAIPLSRRERSGIGTPGVSNRPLSRPPQSREEQIPTDRLPSRRISTPPKQQPLMEPAQSVSPRQNKTPNHKPYDCLDRALRTADLLLQAGGFRVIVLDLGSTPAEHAWRIPLATWFRFRAACERSRVCLLLLTQHACARTSAEVVLHMHPATMQSIGQVMTGVAFHAELERQREHRLVSNVVPMSKSPRPSCEGRWTSRNTWVRA